VVVVIVVGGGWTGDGAPRATPAPTIRAVRCPDCGSLHVRIRSSAGQISYLECEPCGHQWKNCEKIARILVIL
jgi:hypothetical protein